VITSKKLCPLLAMNPKAISLLSPVITTKKLYPLLAMNPKVVSFLDPVINQEANPLLTMNPKAVSLLSPMFNQKDLLLKTITKSRSLEKIFVRMEEERKKE